MVRTERASLSRAQLRSVASLVDANDCVAIYGSVARGDARADSDVDVLVVGPRSVEQTQDGALSVTVYQESHLRELALSGSLFVLHLKEEASVLKDVTGALGRVFAAWRPPDVERTAAGMRAAAAVLDVAPSFERDHAQAFADVAVFLVRSALYLRCVERGAPVYALKRVAEVLGDPDITSYFAAARERRSAPSETVRHGRALLARYLGGPITNPCGTLEALAVSCHRPYPLAADLATRLLTKSRPLHYASAPAYWWRP